MPEDIYERLQIGVLCAGPNAVLSSGPIPSCVSTEAFVAYLDRYEHEYCVLLWIPVRVQTAIFQLLLGVVFIGLQSILLSLIRELLLPNVTHINTLATSSFILLFTIPHLLATSRQHEDLHRHCFQLCCDSGSYAAVSSPAANPGRSHPRSAVSHSSNLAWTSCLQFIRSGEVGAITGSAASGKFSRSEDWSAASRNTKRSDDVGFIAIP